MSLVINYKRADVMLPVGATPLGYAASESMTFEQWLADGERLNLIDKWKNFAIGDWLLAGANRFGEVCYQAVDEHRWGSYYKVTKLVWVARNVPYENRDMRLTWTHHHAVADLPPNEQRKWLKQAADNEMTVSELKDAITEAKPRSPSLSNGDDELLLVDMPSVTEQSNTGLFLSDEIHERQNGHLTGEPESTTDRLAVHYSSETAEHYTPQEIIDAVIACLGAIDLDPCSNSLIEPNVPAFIHYTAVDDGLIQTWFGRVYMNPPYGDAIKKWVEKLCDEYNWGHLREAIALVPARTDTRWWKQLRDYPVCLVQGRLKFGEAENSAPFPSAAFYLGKDVARFCRSFRHLGDIWRRIEPDTGE